VGDIGFCKVCGDTFDKRNDEHVVCSKRECRREYYGRKKAKTYNAEPIDEIFTPIIREMIVEILEFRKSFPMSQIYREIGRRQNNTAVEIQRMKDTGEYTRILEGLKRKRRI
jgi:hypothetical protein